MRRAGSRINVASTVGVSADHHGHNCVPFPVRTVRILTLVGVSATLQSVFKRHSGIVFKGPSGICLNRLASAGPSSRWGGTQVTPATQVEYAKMRQCVEARTPTFPLRIQRVTLLGERGIQYLPEP
jgi:hypothetical protein